MKIKDKNRLIARMLAAIAVTSTIITTGLEVNLFTNKDEIYERTPEENIAYQTATTASGVVAASSTCMAITGHYMLKRKKHSKHNDDTYEK